MVKQTVYRLYRLARQIIRATGLLKPVRALLGPVIGRMVYRVAKGADGAVDVHGHRMYLAPPKGYPPLDMLAGRYEPESSKLFEQIAKPGMFVLDIGAHVGYYSLIAAGKVGPNGKVYAFEPEPMNHELLTKNVALNKYDNIHIVNKAVSDHDGSGTLFLSGLDNGRHTLFQQHTAQATVNTITLTTLDAFLESEGWPNIGLLKIDVEGAEQSVLAGMSQFLEKNRTLHMIIEFNPILLRNASVDLVEYLKQTKQWGFEISVIDEKTGLTPLNDQEIPELVDRLQAAESSVNLHYARQ